VQKKNSGTEPDVALLPNGLSVAYQSRVEVEHFYRDIFTEEVYLGGGLELPPGAVVLDVGANIGMFTLFATLRSPGARVFSFEPAPPLFAILSANAARHAPAARLFNQGVADRSGVAELCFYPGSSGMSSFHADRTEERDALRAVVENQAREGDEGARALLAGDLDDYLEDRLRSVTYSCPLTTLGRVIREQGLERVDLLKVDVQKSELAVLQGLGDDDWPKVRQVAVEVHDLDGRVDRLVELLEARGHEVVVEQEELYRGSDIFLLYGRRPKAPAGEGARGFVAPPPRPASLLVWSAPSPGVLERRTQGLAEALEGRPEGDLPALAATLQRTRPAEAHRRWLVAGDAGEARSALASKAWSEEESGPMSPAVAFLFPGLGHHHPAMAADLLRTEPDFRRHVVESCALLEPLLGEDLTSQLTGLGDGAGNRSGVDLRALLGRDSRDGEGARNPGELARTRLAQPALFVVELALARLWERWGVRPDAVAGYSLGELTAACVAGVFSREDALRLVAHRARLIDALPEGALLAVSLPRKALAHYLGPDLSVTSEIGPAVNVVGGPPPAVEELAARLESDGAVCRRVSASHAFHSEMLRPAVEPFTAAVAAVEHRPPEIPLLSNVTGDWITPEEATDPAYWGEHLVRPVRFSATLERLWGQPGRAFLEVGPGGTLGAWALQHPAAAQAGASPLVLPSLPHDLDTRDDHGVMLRSLGRLWAGGLEVDWDGVHGERPRRLVELPPELVVDEPLEESGSGESAADADAPRSDLETHLAALWCRVLERQRVARRDNFFEIGGDSLRATRLIAACRDELGYTLTLRRLFDTPTLCDLAAGLEAGGPPATA
jgi:FkbM family methyltransferase